ncbi:MAG: alpha-L-fucosidase [Planctomycetota bacterium]|jgi:alpha-L-fucosidase
MLRNKSTNISIVIVLCFVVCCVVALPTGQIKAGTNDYLNAGEQDIRAWREMKFGLFVHWGPVSLKGTEIGWSRGGERRGRTGKGSIPVEVYDNLYKQFNPVKFDAAEWIRGL